MLLTIPATRTAVPLPLPLPLGNFSYYYRTADFGIGRFCQMMWRLNFLVLFCCLALNNSYMCAAGLARGSRLVVCWLGGGGSITNGRVEAGLHSKACQPGLPGRIPLPLACCRFADRVGCAPNHFLPAGCTTSAPCTRSSPSWCTQVGPSGGALLVSQAEFAPSLHVFCLAAGSSSACLPDDQPTPRGWLCSLLTQARGCCNAPNLGACPFCPAALAIGSRYNKSDLAIWLKIGACVLTVFVFWDIKPSELQGFGSSRGSVNGVGNVESDKPA